MKKIFIIIFGFFCIFLRPSYLLANEDINEGTLSHFRSGFDVRPIVNTPTVLEIDISSIYSSSYQFVVKDLNDGSFEPHYIYEKQLSQKEDIPLNATSPTAANSTKLMVDNNNATYSEFALEDSGVSTAVINLRSETPITSSSMNLVLDTNVAYPNYVDISALVDGTKQIVVARRNLNSSVVTFPKVTSNNWEITFTYSQPLRISELKLVQSVTEIKRNNKLRFLALPDHIYKVYFDSDVFISVSTGEAGNLSIAKDVLDLPMGIVTQNLKFKQSDQDYDGVKDINDNCPTLVNPDQKDINLNGTGDVCEDFDLDGVVNSVDNCVNDPNRDQQDTDSDKIGDLCDGIESRLTEQYKFLPWVGILFAAGVLVVLFWLTAKDTEKRK